MSQFFYRTSSPDANKAQQGQLYIRKRLVDATWGRRHTITVLCVDLTGQSVERLARKLCMTDNKDRVPHPAWNHVEESVRERYLDMAMAALGIKKRGLTYVRVRKPKVIDDEQIRVGTRWVDAATWPAYDTKRVYSWRKPRG